MFRDYLVSGFRNSLRDKLTAFLNISGLGVGFAFALIAFLFVRSELSYDGFYEDAQNIYRIDVLVEGFGEDPTAASGYPLKDLLDLEYPEIKSSTRISNVAATLKVNDQLFNETLLWVSPEFFDVFSIPMITGGANNPFSGPSSIILSKRMSEVYFGNEDPMGKIITVNDGIVQDFIVTGVFNDIPDNSHMPYDFLVPEPDAQFMMENYGVLQQSLEHIYRRFNYTYVRLQPGTNIVSLEARLAQYYADNTPEDWIDRYGKSTPLFYPIMDIHLKNTSQDDFALKGSQDLLNGLLLVSGLILFISGINFVNLVTARFTMRAREIGVRKSMGASRQQIIIQFLSETALSCILALILAIFLAWIFLPVFNSLSSKELEFNIFSIDVGLFSIAILFAVTFLAGLYPAYISSAQQPAKILGATSIGGTGKSRLRSILIILQLAIVIGLIASTALINAQARYMQKLEMGFIRENILVIDDGFYRENDLYQQFKDRLELGRDIVATSRGANPSAGFASSISTLDPRNGQPVVKITGSFVGADYFEVLGIEPLAGRTFTQNFPEDVAEIRYDDPDAGGMIINESALNSLGFQFPEEALGKTYWRGTQKIPYTIVGVIPDVINAMARNPIEPQFYAWSQYFNSTLIRYQSDNLTALIENIEQTYRELKPDSVWQYQFLDDQIRLQYEQEEIQARILMSFSLIAIFITLMGLYAMAVFATTRRSKEMGIRKVYGATVNSILGLMAWEFTKPFILASAIAWPTTWYLLDQWLQNFAFRVSTHIPYLLAATAITGLIVMLTVAGHAYRNARVHPVETIRYE